MMSEAHRLPWISAAEPLAGAFYRLYCVGRRERSQPGEAVNRWDALHILRLRHHRNIATHIADLAYAGARTSMPVPRPRRLASLPLSLLLAGASACPATESSAPPPMTPTNVGSPPPPAAPVPTPAQPTDEEPTPASTPPSTSGPLAAALERVPPAVAANYVFALSPDRNELTIDPRPKETRRARAASGFSARDSENGGKVITLAGGPFRGGSWVRGSFSDRVQGAAQLEQLRRAGYDIEQVRDLLVVDGEHDPSSTVFAFSADPGNAGIVGVCSQVTIVDFKPGSTRPVAVRKPVMYLYPPTPTEVRVQLEIDGEFIATYPQIGADGWTVTAHPDGALVDAATGRRHRYLFWEGTSAGFEIDPARAHCVPGEAAAGFLERACDRFALTEEECGDLISYWIPALAGNPYNVIQFVDEQRYGDYARLRVEPRPDAVIRPFMIFRRSETPVSVGAPELPQRTRGRFTVVEWGGADLDAKLDARVHIR